MPKKGYKQTEEHRNKTRKRMRNNKLSVGNKSACYWEGKHLPEEVKKKISNTHKMNGLSAGKNNPNWKGGISLELYPQNWQDDLKDSIRKRDNFICQECGLHQDELMGRVKKLDIHHIDYDKLNCNPDNLITLCRSCHAKTNYNREYWIKYFGVHSRHKTEMR